MDKVRSDEKINNVGALVLNDNKLSKIDLKDFSVRIYPIGVTLYHHYGLPG